MASSNLGDVSGVNNSYADYPAVAPDTHTSLSANIAYVVSVLRRGWRWPFFGLLLGLALGVAYLIYVPALYKSSARILLDRSEKRYLQTNNVLDEPILDETETGSQIYVLSSDSIVVPVVRSMNLANDPEFVGRPDFPGTGSTSLLAQLKLRAKSLLGMKHGAPIDPAVKLERTAVETMLARLTVYREDVANVINVSFVSEDPQKAADIANALADTYLTATEVRQAKSTKLVGQLLEERLVELKQQSGEADRALQEFKLAHNLLSTGKGGSANERITALNTQLTSARIAEAEAKARLNRTQQALNEGNSSASGAANELVMRLRAQYLDLSTKAKEIESKVGAGHVAVVTLRRKLADLNTAIRDEEREIAKSYEVDYNLAQARRDELSAAVTQLVDEAGISGQAETKLRELEGAADTLRTLYNAALRKFNEIKKAQSEVATQDAHIITRAAPPLQKNSNKALAVFAGSIVFGLMAGVGAAFAREWVADVFRTPGQVTRATGLYCAMLPTIRRGRRGLPEYVLDAPYSRFAESIRNIRALIRSAQRSQGVKVIAVTSSLSKEGKSTVVSNLGTFVAASAKSKVLLIDGDIHLRHLTKTLVPDASEGLIEALEAPSRLAKLVVRRERSGMDLLPCALSGRLPNAAELLGSPQMERLLQAARGTYDLILIEVAPVLSVSDVKMIERYIDRFIFVVEWGKTKRSVVGEALVEADMIGDRLLCCVLNKADPGALRSIESYKGRRFREYYEA